MAKYNRPYNISLVCCRPSKSNVIRFMRKQSVKFLIDIKTDTTHVFGCAII